MLKTISVLLLATVCSLPAGQNSMADFVTANATANGKQNKKQTAPLNCMVLENQAAVTTGQNIPWVQPTPTSASGGVQVSNSGLVTLSNAGTYLVQYTVRVSRSPFNGTASVTAQLQQSNGGSPTNISRPAITTTSSNDEITENVPLTQTQISGFALITVASNTTNTINVAVTITGSNMTIDQTSGSDANAQLVILQL